MSRDAQDAHPLGAIDTGFAYPTYSLDHFEPLVREVFAVPPRRSS
jgi:hypothetical protein